MPSTRSRPLNFYANRRPIMVPPRVDCHLKPAPEPTAMVLVIAETKQAALDLMLSYGADPAVVTEGAPYMRYLRLGLPHRWAAVERAGLIDTGRPGVYVARDLEDGDTVFRYADDPRMTPVARVRDGDGSIRVQPVHGSALGALGALATASAAVGCSAEGLTLPLLCLLGLA